MSPCPPRGAQVLGEEHVDCRPALAAAPESERFLLVDSHLNAPGAQHAFHAIAEALGATPARVRNWRDILGSGDLAPKFHGGLVQMYPQPSIEESAAFQRRLTLIADIPAVDGAHQGRTTEWRNDEPSDPRRVLCFANSFFSPGERPEHLTWWFARTFAQTRFVWSPHVIWEEVERFKPDIVLSQTIERFLGAVPVS